MAQPGLADGTPTLSPHHVEPDEAGDDTGHARRLRLITVDQALSSASNILIAVLAARLLGAEGFGLYGVVFVAATASQGVTRALVAEPLLVRPHESEERPGEAIGTAAILGAGVGALVAVIGGITALWSRDLGLALLLLGLCTPLLVLQDLGRYMAFAVQRPERAIVLDVTWLGLLVVAAIVLGATDTASLTWFIAAWTGSGALAGTLLLWQYRAARIEPTLGWLRETWPFSWRYALSFGARQGSVLLVASMLAGVLGSRSLGALRGALLLFGPLQQLQVAAIAAGVAEVSRITGTDDAVRRHIRRTTLLTTSMAAANLAVVLVLPDRLGVMVLGDTWEGTQRLLWPAGLQLVFVGLISGVRSALLGLGATTTAVRVDITTAIAMVAATFLGVLLWDVRGVFWATCATQGALTTLWWVAYLRHRRRRPHDGRPVGQGSVDPLGGLPTAGNLPG